MFGDLSERQLEELRSKLQGNLTGGELGDLSEQEIEALRAKLQAKLDGKPHKPPPMSLMGVIFDREKRPRVQPVMEGRHVMFSLITLGHGTANSRILGYLGLGESEKAVLLSVLPTEKAAEILARLDETLDFKKPGNGVAFICPVRQGCYRRLVNIEEENKEGEPMDTKAAHELIIVVNNRGYTEEVMDAARAAGATGGTVLHAQGCGLSGAEKFFGVTIQPEKEMMFILAGADNSCAIMESIAATSGPGTDSNAVSFSLPVDNIFGIGQDVPDEIARK